MGATRSDEKDSHDDDLTMMMAMVKMMMVVIVIVDTVGVNVDRECHLQHSWLVLLGIEKDLFNLTSVKAELPITTLYSICIKKSDSFVGL